MPSYELYVSIVSTLVQVVFIVILIYTITRFGRAVTNGSKPGEPIGKILDENREIKGQLNELTVLLSESLHKHTDEETIKRIETVNLSAETVARFKIVDNLNRYFSLEDIKTLCFYRDIPYDNLAGDTKQGKIVSLLEYIEDSNHDGLRKFIKLAKEHKPQVTDWPDMKKGS